MGLRRGMQVSPMPSAASSYTPTQHLTPTRWGKLAAGQQVLLDLVHEHGANTAVLTGLTWPATHLICTFHTTPVKAVVRAARYAY